MAEQGREPERPTAWWLKSESMAAARLRLSFAERSWRVSLQPFQMARLFDAPLHTSRITCECKVWRLRKNHRIGGLVVFRGVYPPGSAGIDDARYIHWLLSEFYTMHHPDGLVVDCRELDYVWGDDLAFPEPKPHKADRVPFLVVLRPEQQEAFDYAVPRSEQRLDLDVALAEVDEEIRAMKSLL